MKSTGEVMGIDRTYGAALAKAIEASGLGLRTGESVLLSISDATKAEALPLIRKLADSGSKIYATEGTSTMLRGLDIECETVTKVLSGGHPKRSRRYQ